MSVGKLPGNLNSTPPDPAVATNTAASNPPATKADGSKKKFSEVWNQIQAKMGAKPEAPRQIKKTLDKDDFLRLMVTQMRHQDPTKPFDADKMASEMAQVASVEQLKNISGGIEKLSRENQPIERLAMTHLIGKEVKINRNRFPHTKGLVSPISFDLPKAAGEVKVEVLNLRGEKIFEKDMGELAEGKHDFNWDGKMANTLDAETGNYLLKINAVSPEGKTIPINPVKQERIVGVSFEGQEAVFLVGDANRQEKITMDTVVQIADFEGQGMNAQKKPAANQISAQQSSNPPAQQPIQNNLKSSGKEVAGR